MKLVSYAFALVFLIVNEGMGAWFKRMLGMERVGYHAPIGFALFLAVAQFFYYPAEIFNHSMIWIIITSFVLFLFGVICVIYDLGDIRKSLFRKESLILIAVFVLFAALNEFHDVLGTAVDETLLTTSVRDLPGPLYQGYYQFAAAFSWFVNCPHQLVQVIPSVSASAAKVYGLGLLYALMSSMVIIDIVRSFHLRNHWFGFSLMVYLLLNGNYTAWQKGTAWIGLSWSILFVTLAVYVSYEYIRSGNEQVKYLLIPVLAAGLASDNSFGLSGLAVLYGFVVYLFSIRKIRSLFDFITLLFPHVLYSLAISLKYFPLPLAAALLALWILFYLSRYRKPIRKWIWRTEELCFDHWKEIFLIGVPVLLTAGSLLLVLSGNGEGLATYRYYFSDFHEIPGVRDYLFIHSDWIEIVLNLFRWGGFVTLVLLAKEGCDRAVRMMLIAVLIVFLNPLTTPIISYMTGPMFFHTFHVLFNPFTEAIMFLFVYRMFQWTVIGQWVLEIALCFGAFIGLSGILP